MLFEVRESQEFVEVFLQVLLSGVRPWRIVKNLNCLLVCLWPTFVKMSLPYCIHVHTWEVIRNHALCFNSKPMSKMYHTKYVCSLVILSTRSLQNHKCSNLKENLEHQSINSWHDTESLWIIRSNRTFSPFVQTQFKEILNGLTIQEELSICLKNCWGWVEKVYFF